MKELEYLRNISIGQYIARESYVHRLHPAAKIACLAIIITTTLIASDYFTFLMLSFLLTFIVILAKIPIPYILRGFLPALPFLLFIAVLQIFFIPSLDGSSVLWEISKPFVIRITSEELYSVARLFLRFFLLMSGFSSFSSVTNTGEISHGVEKLFSPLKGLGFPAHESSLLVTIVFRFIPILASEAERIVKAQAARGADFGTHRGGPIKRILRFFPIFLPLFQSALYRAEELIDAMEVKCYSGGKGRSSLRLSPIRQKDLGAILICFFFCLVALLIGFIG